MDGVAQGAAAVRTIVVGIHTLYTGQKFNYVGPYRDNGVLDDYTAQVHGEPISCVVLVTRNAAGKAQHIVANYRPRSSLLLLSRLLGEKFAGTPLATHFIASAPHADVPRPPPPNRRFGNHPHSLHERGVSRAGD